MPCKFVFNYNFFPSLFYLLYLNVKLLHTAWEFSVHRVPLPPPHTPTPSVLCRVLDWARPDEPGWGLCIHGKCQKELCALLSLPPITLSEGIPMVMMIVDLNLPILVGGRGRGGKTRKKKKKRKKKTFVILRSDLRQTRKAHYCFWLDHNVSSVTTEFLWTRGLC